MSHALLRTLEESLLTPSVRGDSHRLTALLHPTFVEVGRSGRRWTRAQITAELTTEQEREEPQTDEWEFVNLSPTLILVTYVILGTGHASRHSSVWDVAGGSPRLRFHQGTPIIRT